MESKAGKGINLESKRSIIVFWVRSDGEIRNKYSTGVKNKIKTNCSKCDELFCFLLLTRRFEIAQDDMD